MKCGRNRPGAVTVAADEDGGWLWTRETRSLQKRVDILSTHSKNSSLGLVLAVDGVEH